jgi:hypothetical protein
MLLDELTLCEFVVFVTVSLDELEFCWVEVLVLVLLLLFM